MSFKEKLSKYAQLIVKAGLNVQPAQIVVIDAPVESVELVRLVTKEAYAAGAREVVVKYNDCLLYTSPSPRDYAASRMPSSA